MHAWDAMHAWDQTEPLIISFSGTTGVGKTEMAYRLAEGMLAKTETENTDGLKKESPKGYLPIDGSRYSKSSIKNVQQARQELEMEIISHLKKCNGNSVIVFDDMQKMEPGVIDAVLPALEKHGSFSYSYEEQSYSEYFSSWYNGKRYSIKKTGYVSTARAVFIFISDIYNDALKTALVDYQERSSIPKTILKYMMEEHIDRHWERLRLGKRIGEVISFMPLQRSHVMDIFYKHIRNHAESRRSIDWVDIFVDEKVIEFLTGPRFVKYTTIGEGGNSANRLTFSTYGGRPVTQSWGWGPMRTLQKILRTHMQPWQQNKVIHVGLLGPHDSTSRTTRLKEWRAEPALIDNKDEPVLYLQWCHFDERMNGTNVCENEDTCSRTFRSVPEEIAFSPQKCERKWFGVLSRRKLSFI
jgi:DNA polymerase III delta prime subunit